MTEITPVEAAEQTFMLPNKAAWEGIQTLFLSAGFRGSKYREAVNAAWEERKGMFDPSRNQESQALPDNPASRVNKGVK